MTTMQKTIDRDFVARVGGHVLSAQLAAMRDPGAAGGDTLDRLADMSVRAALALDAAIPRAEERLAAEAKAAQDAEAAALAAAKAATLAEAKADADRAEAARVAAREAAVAAKAPGGAAAAPEKAPLPEAGGHAARK